MGPHLRMRWDTWGSSRVVAGNSAFISSCDGDLWAPLSGQKVIKFLSCFERELGIAFEVRQEKRATPCVDRDIPWFVSSCGWRLEIPLQVPRGTQGASRVASGKSSLHSSCEGEHGSALESRQGNQASIHMEGGISRCFSSCSRKCGFPRVATGT